VPNPWPPTTPGSPCDNAEATPQKVCGAVTTGGTVASAGGSVLARNVSLPTARRVFSVVMTNPSATDYYLQIFDSAANPGNGAVPIAAVACAAGDVAYFDVAGGYPLTNGLFAANSTTQGTLTAGGADCLFAIAYSA